MAKKDSKEDLLNLEEKQKRFHKDNFWLINRYITKFHDGAKAVINSDDSFESIKKEVIDLRDEIAFKFYIDPSEVCEFAFATYSRMGIRRLYNQSFAKQHIYQNSNDMTRYDRVKETLDKFPKENLRSCPSKKTCGCACRGCVTSCGIRPSELQWYLSQK